MSFSAEDIELVEISRMVDRWRRCVRSVLDALAAVHRWEAEEKIQEMLGCWPDAYIVTRRQLEGRASYSTSAGDVIDQQDSEP